MKVEKMDVAHILIAFPNTESRRPFSTNAPLLTGGVVVSACAQLMPLQETLWLPQQIAATKTQVENWTQRAKALEAQLVLRTQEKVALQVGTGWYWLVQRLRNCGAT